VQEAEREEQGNDEGDGPKVIEGMAGDHRV
jgi:hypothetical protein